MLWNKQKSKVSKTSQIIVEDIDVQIVRKKIKNLHLRVYPPDGRVRVAVPMHIKDDVIRLTVMDKLTWIRKQQVRLAKLPAPTSREMISGEYHYYLGESYPLEVIERQGKHELVLQNNSQLLLYVRPDTDVDKRVLVLTEWYRQQIKALLPELIQKWEPIVGVKVEEWAIKKMKTRWGTCNINSSRIWLNLELMKKPMECLEYVLVHEMVHLLERYHNKNFKAYMDRFMPDWRLLDEVLKREPLARDY
ncbi:MAG: M48 family metallopeptidase [Gammaproteobacteria bacterium]|nr:M48 family metallopeptidase [Gammaproteobacteria bacterium]